MYVSTVRALVRACTYYDGTNYVLCQGCAGASASGQAYGGALGGVDGLGDVHPPPLALTSLELAVSPPAGEHAVYYAIFYLCYIQCYILCYLLCYLRHRGHSLLRP